MYFCKPIIAVGFVALNTLKVSSLGIERKSYTPPSLTRFTAVAGSGSSYRALRRAVRRYTPCVA